MIFGKVYEPTILLSIVCWLYDGLYVYLYDTTTREYDGTLTRTAVTKLAIKENERGKLLQSKRWFAMDTATRNGVRQLKSVKRM